MASICSLLLVAWLMVHSASSARIVGFSSMSSGSHYLLISTVLEELASRGHEVVMVVSSDFKQSRSSEAIPHKVYQVPYGPGFIEDFIVKAAMEKSIWHAMIRITEFSKVSCDCLLNSTELLQDIRNFDLIVYEGMALCVNLVGESLGIPRVAIMPGVPHLSSFLMIPAPVSYVPVPLTGFTDKMSFLQRVLNLGAHVATTVLFDQLVVGSFASLKTKYNITPGTSFRRLFGNDELVIFSTDFALEYPFPLLPGTIMAGPITVKKPKPLSTELEDFVQSGDYQDHGFIIVSFGSYMETLLAKEKIDVLAAVFGKLKQKVIWKLKNYIPPSLSSNIKLVDWLPQSDLLAHKDIRAFVSHVGHNSLYETAYHGVPVVAVPLFADQFSNSKKAEHFGLGLAVNIETLDAEELLKTIQHVVNEPRFKKEAMCISKLMKDRPRTPLETTGDWIEYVLRHGGARHLRAQVFNIPWYQYYLLDVIVFLVAVVTLVAMVIRMTCRCLCRLCCKRSGTKPKKE